MDLVTSVKLHCLPTRHLNMNVRGMISKFSNDVKINDVDHEEDIGLMARTDFNPSYQKVLYFGRTIGGAKHLDEHLNCQGKQG